MGGCPPPADKAGAAETISEQATLERQRIDEFGRIADQREWTSQYIPVEETDKAGDIIPDGFFSTSDGHDVADIADLEDYDSEIDDPSAFPG